MAILTPPLSFLGAFLANAIAGTTVFLLPSVFGFLAWELKENWKLYRASRPRMLQPVRVGAHGETMHGLLVPGFHSGTLPKLYERLRRAAQREDMRSSLVDAQELRPGEPTRVDASLGRFRQGIQEVEEAVRRFVDRELCELLMRDRRWTAGKLQTTSVELGSNRVRIRVICRALGADPCEITFEEQSGLLIASVPRAGFVAALRSDEQVRTLFENALMGLYQLAGVDLVHEQVEAALGGHTPYDISDEGLVTWPGGDYRTEVVYRLRRGGGPVLEPRLRGEPPAQPPPPLDERHVLLEHQSIPWSAWVHAWTGGDRGGAPPPRLVRGASILP
jgi:hypothetical protein